VASPFLTAACRAPRAAIVLSLLATPASAHLVSSGLGPVYDSVLHLLMSPEYLALVLGVAIWSGLKGARHGRWALFVLPAAWLVGAFVGPAAVGIPASIIVAIACVGLGGLIAADLSLPLSATIAVAASIGFFAAAMHAAAESSSHLPGLLGVTAAIFVLMALVSSLIVPVRILWVRIAVRVAGSWLAALGILLGGWALRAAH
jgi:hypothetical protein